MSAEPSVVIDVFPESARRYHGTHAIVAVDVIRATTTAVTAVALGRRCHPAATLEAAMALAAELTEPLLAGELGGNMPYGFDMTNSPAELLRRTDAHRPMVLLSTSGTQLLVEAAAGAATYAACLRNHAAQARHLIGRHARVAVIGAGSRAEFREEDQLCCAWIAEALIAAGYRAEGDDTRRIVDRWSGARSDAFLDSKSVDYLRRSNQLHDLEFVLSHVDDLAATFAMRGGELVMDPEDARRRGQPA